MSRTPALGGPVSNLRRLWRPAARSPLPLGLRLAPPRLFHHWDSEPDQQPESAQGGSLSSGEGPRKVQPFRIVEAELKPRPRRRIEPDLPCLEISDAIIDLDALSAPGVRLFDDYDQRAEHARWEVTMDKAEGKETMLAYVDQLEKAQADYEEVRDNNEKARWRIRDYDILSAALQGTHLPPPDTIPNLGGSRPMTHSEKKFDLPCVLRMNGIHPMIWEDTPLLLKWMIDRHEVVDPRTTEDQDTTFPPFAEGFNHGPQSLKRLGYRRLVSLALATKRGVTDDGKGESQTKFIVRLLGNMGVTDTTENLYTRLLFLGSLRRALELSGCRLDYQVCAAGMQCSLKARLLGHATEYLNLLVEHPDAPTDFVKETLRETLQQAEIVVDTILGFKDSNGPTIATSVDRLELLQFLRPLRGALASLELNDASYATYIRILAKLGALRTLWHEWQEATAQLGGGKAWETKIKALARVFAGAFMEGCGAVLQYDPKAKTKAKTEVTDFAALDYAALPANIEPLPLNKKFGVPSQLPSRLGMALGFKAQEQSLFMVQSLMGSFAKHALDEIAKRSRDSFPARPRG